MPPTYGHGKICYVEIPAVDVEVSSRFYREVFGWTLRRRGDGSIAFDDGVGEVSGTWVTGLAPASGGLRVYIMVENAAQTSERIVAQGGEIVQPSDSNAQVIFAHFRDPGGNLVGIYQQK